MPVILQSLRILHIQLGYLLIMKKKKTLHVQKIDPCKLNRHLAQAVFPLSGLRHPQFGTVWFGN